MANYLNYRARQNLAPQAGRKHLEQLERIEERLIDSAQARVEFRCDSLDQKDPAGLSDDLPDWLSGPPATGPNVTVRKWRDYLPAEMPTSENISWRQAEQSATRRSPEAEETREKENESRRRQIHELNVKLLPDSQAGLESAKPAESAPTNAPSPDTLWGGSTLPAGVQKEGGKVAGYIRRQGSVLRGYSRSLLPQIPT